MNKETPHGISEAARMKFKNDCLSHLRNTIRSLLPLEEIEEFGKECARIDDEYVTELKRAIELHKTMGWLGEER